MRDHPLLERELLADALGARYQIVRLIGRGGAGSVFLCRDTALHRSVAVKMLRPEFVELDEYRELFRREARLGAQLGDPGTVPVLDIVDVPGVFAFVMPYAGISLREIVTRRGPLDAALVQRILILVSDVLSRLHRRGLHHRDIKPDNVLVEGEGEDMRVRLSDFGIAMTPMADRGSTNPLFMSGTPQFMSPEQALHAIDADQRSDVYALGALAYYLLTGAVPFDASAMADIVALQREERYTPLRSRCHDVPPALEHAVRKCLRANPNRRWPHAGALRDALIEQTRPTALMRISSALRGAGRHFVARVKGVPLTSGPTPQFRVQ